MKTLDDVKKTLRQTYLPKAGVHGIGLNRSQNAIRLYVDTGYPGDPQAQPVLQQIKKAASPYNLIVVEEEKPTISCIAVVSHH